MVSVRSAAGAALLADHAGLFPLVERDSVHVGWLAGCGWLSDD